MKSEEIFNKTKEVLGLKEEELYFKDGHSTPLGLVLNTASAIGSGELNIKKFQKKEKGK